MMRSTRKILSIMVIILSAVSIPSLWACWIDDGLPVCTVADSQQDQKMIPDGEGGVIIAWEDYRGSDIDIYAQRMDGSGNILWTSDGQAICIVSGSQYDLQLVQAGTGSAIIVWRDNRNGFDPEIYAQKISSSGSFPWGADVAICSVPDAQNSPQIVSDGAGGAIIVWECNRGGVDYDIYAQRVNSAGAVQWTADGIAVCSEKYDQTDPKIITDGSGGAVIAWIDDSSGNGDVVAQRIDDLGVLQWAAEGVPVCTAIDDQGFVHIVSDGDGGAIITWEDLRGGDSDIYAQRIDNKGDVQWASDGIPVSSLAEDQCFPEIITDGAGGAIIEWHDTRDGVYDIYAQRVSDSGTLLWTAGGAPVCTTPFSKYGMKIASDGAEGAIITWADYRGGSYDVFAQRIDSTGNILWDGDGNTICDPENNQSWPEIVEDTEGGAFIAWRDLRSGSNDIYAQLITEYGTLTYYPTISSISDVPNDQGGKLVVSWGAVCQDVYPETEITYYSLWRRLDLPLLSSVPASNECTVPEVPADFEGTAVRVTASGYSWEWLASIPARYFDSYSYLAVSLYDSIGSDPGWQYFVVTAHTPLQYVFFDSPIDSGYSVDNLSPFAPEGLSAEQSYDPEGLDLAWDANGEADLHHYDVYRGTYEGFVPSYENLIGSPYDPEFFDSDWRWDLGYWYRIAAVDIHGNISETALIGPGSITGDDLPQVPIAAFLGQNAPNPFNPSTVIEFGLTQQQQVSLRIYDPAGRLVATLIDRQMPAGRYKTGWDGRDNSGSAVASGVYFYRLVAGGFRETRKMVLLR